MDLKKLLINDIFNKTLSFLSSEESIRLDCYNPRRGYIHPIDGMFYAVKHGKYDLLSYFEKEGLKWVQTIEETDDIYNYLCKPFHQMIINYILSDSLDSPERFYSDHERESIELNCNYKTILTTLLCLASSEDRIDMCNFFISKGGELSSRVINYASGDTRIILQDRWNAIIRPVWIITRVQRDSNYVNPYYLRGSRLN